jgi:hypothetical protein
MVYGLAAEPQTVVSNMRALTDILPNNVALFIGEQLLSAVETAKETKGLGILVALAFAFYGGRQWRRGDHHRAQHRLSGKGKAQPDALLSDRAADDAAGGGFRRAGPRRDRRHCLP